MELRSAQQLVWDMTKPMGGEWVTLDQALGRVLAQPLVAPANLPAESRSRMDGYAVRSHDVAGASPETPMTLELSAGYAAAGHACAHTLAPGECLRILTGAPLPAGADAVLAQEQVDLQGNRLVVKRAVPCGQSVTPPGADVRQAEIVLAPGAVLTPTHLAMAAALGCAGLKVHRRPTVALLGTGDELMELGELRDGPNAYCNNRHLLAWMVRLQGGCPIHLGVAGDDPSEIATGLANADADLVITTGGIGRGDRDCILKAWESLRVTVHFRQVDLSPGRSSAFGSVHQQLYCALPGNPWAAQVVFSEIIAPMIRRWQGLALREPVTLLARLDADLQNRSGLHRAIRGTLRSRDGVSYFQPGLAKHGSLFSQLAASPAYALIPPEARELAAGDVVSVGLFAFPLMSVGSLANRLVR